MLTVRDLSVARGGVPVLEGLGFAVAAGEALVLRGPNGVGKTSLLRVLAGLEPPRAGHVECAAPPALATHADGVKPALTVAENLSFWAEVHGGVDVAAAMRDFDVEALAGRMAGTLSAGQKRRLGLARMALTGRALWLFDEPTVSLDTASVAIFADRVRAHLAAGGAAVIATHIDLGLEGRTLDLTPYRAVPAALDDDEAFL